MLQAHAVAALAQARSYVAALADNSLNNQAASAYEHVLLELDWIHDDDVPALHTVDLDDDHAVLVGTATSVIEALAAYGVDALHVELVLAMLDTATARDVP